MDIADLERDLFGNNCLQEHARSTVMSKLDQMKQTNVSRMSMLRGSMVYEARINAIKSKNAEIDSKSRDLSGLNQMFNVENMD